MVVTWLQDRIPNDVFNVPGHISAIFVLFIQGSILSTTVIKSKYHSTLKNTEDALRPAASNPLSYSSLYVRTNKHTHLINTQIHSSEISGRSICIPKNCFK